MRFQEWVLAAVVAVFLVFVGVASFLAYDTARRVTVESGEVVQPTALPPAPTVALAASAPTAAPVTPTEGPTPTPTLEFAPRDDPERVTVLLLGVDERDIEEGPWRTDTIMLLSFDPVRSTVSMLSIPRDLWVNIPGYQPARINMANFFGDGTNFPGGGPVLAMRAVEATLGVSVDHYVLINFETFLTLADTLISAIGRPGVEICVPEEIDDPAYPEPGGYGTIRVNFPAGCQDMDAEALLQYARTRHGNSDFDRAARQQQIIRAIKDEVVSVGGIQALIGQAQAVWEAVREGVRTDLAFDQIISLALAAQSVPGENIRSAILDQHYVTFERTTDGQEVLVPQRDSVRALVQMLFSPPLSQQELASLARSREAGAAITVTNGTSVEGLAASAADVLRNAGLNVGAVLPADSNNYEESVIWVRTGRWYSAWYAASLLGIHPEVAQPGRGGFPGDWDILIILGADYAGAGQQPQVSAADAER
ncbi:MAG: LCP family protein [Anaerolineae bacterium]|nr:LCP family protein [Anaerolineae bacterium]